MAVTQEYDYIIAGAGAAGLSLLWHLLESPLKGKRILVIDNSFQPDGDKTWCFWKTEHLFASMSYHTWDELEVISNGEVFTEKMEKYSYHCIRSEEYQRKIIEKAHLEKTVTFLESYIQNFIDSQSGGVVKTFDGDYKAEWVFQSVLKSRSYNTSTVDNILIQHFAGWEIESEKDFFNPQKATLMDFDTEQKKGLTFFYTLPFSPRRALVEYTIFSESILEEHQYEARIREYLKNRYKLESSDYSVIRTERGAIPMEDRRVPGFYNSHTINLGTVGGVTKPTTGYTFTRAHEHSRQIVELLKKDKKPAPYTGSSYRFRVYDMMLLYLLRHEPKNSRDIFHELFKRNSIERVLQFLGEETNFIRELEIFSKLPYLPFFRSIYKMKHRILTGA